MILRDAAERVLRQAGTALSADEIAKRVLEQELWETTGKTPAASVRACLDGDIKQKGDDSAFVKTAPQTFGLREVGATPVPRPSAESETREPVQRETGQTYSFLDAAAKVLEQFGKKKPMHYREVTAKALEQGWLETEGKTPEATMYAQVLGEIKRHRKRGEQPRFVQHGNGYIGLSRWMGRGLAFEIEQHNRKVRKKLRKRLMEKDPHEFEELVARLLVELGFEDIEVTRRSGDGGIDVRATLVVGEVIRTQMAVQVKRWKRNIQVHQVQQVRGSLGTHEQGLIVTTSDFSKGAREEAERPDAVPVALMNGEQLALLLAENEIGASRRSHEIIELEEVADPG